MLVVTRISPGSLHLGQITAVTVPTAAPNRRLHTRWVDFDSRKKRSVIANVAIARELAGWCWSLTVMPD